MRTVATINPQTPPSSTTLASLSSPGHPVSSISESLRVSKNCRRTRKVRTKKGRRMSFHLAIPLTDFDVKSSDVLPDDVLLVIFDFYVVPKDNSKGQIEMWITLVHVDRRWRNLVFGSPRHLDLRLVYKPGPRTSRMLDVWPALPLLIQSSLFPDDDYITAGLERSDRVRHIRQEYFENSLCEKVWAAMQVPFPNLTILSFGSIDVTPLVIPDSFLGRSAPRLQFFRLYRIPFPGLPKLLSSTTHLFELRLQDIPHSGYISPEAMVTCLSTLTHLERLDLEFSSPRSHPDLEIRCLPPPKRSVLPALMYFRFKGVSEYLEDLVTCVDTPKLKAFYITLNQIDFDNSQLAQFIKRTVKAEAYVYSRNNTVTISHSS